MVVGLILMLLSAFLDPLRCLWTPLSHFFLLEHSWLICFSWTSLADFLILHTYGLLLTLLDFPGPITLSFILGIYGLSINPLLSYFITSGMLQPIITFLYHIMPMSLLLVSFRVLLGPFAFLRAHLCTLWAYEPLFMPFRLNGFF